MDNQLIRNLPGLNLPSIFQIPAVCSSIPGLPATWPQQSPEIQLNRINLCLIRIPQRCRIRFLDPGHPSNHPAAVAALDTAEPDSDLTDPDSAELPDLAVPDPDSTKPDPAVSPDLAGPHQYLADMDPERLTLWIKILSR